MGNFHVHVSFKKCIPEQICIVVFAIMVEFNCSSKKDKVSCDTSKAN